MVVFSWNVHDSLRQCLTAAQASQGIKARLVVVDNASRDGSAELVRREFPHVTLITNPTNRGFAAAVNQALEHARGHILLLNPDVRLQTTTVRTMVSWFARRPEIGIIGPRLRYPDGSLQPSVRRFPRWIDLVLVLSKLPNLLPVLAQRYQAVDFDYTTTQTVDQVMGSCCLIRQETLAQVGRFDQGFWIWYEEVDYCLRAKQAGWLTLYVAEAEVAHSRGQSFQQLSATVKQGYLRQSIRHYVRKHFGGLAAWALLPWLWISWLAASLIDVAHLRKPLAAKEF